MATQGKQEWLGDRRKMEFSEEERREWVWVSLKFKVSCKRKGGTGRLMCGTERPSPGTTVMGRDKVSSGQRNP